MSLVLRANEKNCLQPHVSLYFEKAQYFVGAVVASNQPSIIKDEQFQDDRFQH